MKYALIGCGRISPNHIVAAQNNGLEIAAFCDKVRENMDDKIRKFDVGGGNLKTYMDYRELLENERPQLAAIATDSGSHAQIALACIQAGCHVLIEKPIALSLADADAVIKAAKVQHVKVGVCHQNRFNKAVLKIRSAVEKGRFGKMLYGTAQIRWARDYAYYHRASWRGTWEKDGGALMNQCIHDIDLLRWMMGDEIAEVCAMTDRMVHDYIEAEDFGGALIRFANGSYGIIEGTTNIFPRNLEETLCLFGEKGTVKAGGESVNRIEEWNFADYMDVPEQVKQEYSEQPPNIYGFGHTKLYRDIIQAITDDREPYVDAMAGRRALELVLGIYQAAAAKERVVFPIQQCSTMDFIGRFEKDRLEKGRFAKDCFAKDRIGERYDRK